MILFLKLGPLFEIICASIPNRMMILCSMNFIILGPFMDTISVASTHFVKYYVLVVIKVFPPNEGRLN